MTAKDESKLMGMIADLSLEVAKLSARVAELELHSAVGMPTEPLGAPDEATERKNRRMVDGIMNLLNFDGRPQEAGNEE